MCFLAPNRFQPAPDDFIICEQQQLFGGIALTVKMGQCSQFEALGCNFDLGDWVAQAVAEHGAGSVMKSAITKIVMDS